MPNPIEGLRNAQGRPLLSGAQTIQAAPTGDMSPDLLMRGEMPFLGTGGTGGPLAALKRAFQPASAEMPHAEVMQSLFDAIQGNGEMPNLPRPPKPGGVVEGVLSRAGAKQGAGEAVHPSEGRLMELYSKLIR